jgi:hypothetical protein
MGRRRDKKADRRLGMLIDDRSETSVDEDGIEWKEFLGKGELWSRGYIHGWGNAIVDFA